MSIHIKNAHELQRMRAANAIVAAALKLAQEAVRPGLKTIELSCMIEDYICSQGAIPSFKGYPGEAGPFPAAACISVNDVVVHGIPTSYALQEGDIVSVDIGAVLEGYHGDAARTFAVGDLPEDKARLIRITEQSFWDGMAQALAGKRIGDLSAAVQATAEAAGYGVVRELVGHGIGTEMHEPPDVPNFGKAGHGPRLQAGMCLAVEPMINMGAPDVYLDKDGWTIRTADHLPSAHYENTIIITDGEPEVLTLF